MSVSCPNPLKHKRNSPYTIQSTPNNHIQLIRWFGETQPAVEALNTAVGHRFDHGRVASENVLKNRPTTFQQARSGSKSAIAIGMVLIDLGDLSVSWPKIS